MLIKLLVQIVHVISPCPLTRALRGKDMIMRPEHAERTRRTVACTECNFTIAQFVMQEKGDVKTLLLVDT